MKQSNLYFGFLALGLGLAACSESSSIDVPGKDTNSDAISFKAAVEGNSMIATRAASVSKYPSGTILKVGFTSNNADINAAMEGHRTTTLTTVGEGDAQTLTPKPILYWNDMGGRDADLNVWGVYTSTQDVAVSDAGALTWDVAANQQNGILPYDLHWSNNVRNLKYKNNVDLQFSHAMSKVTMILTVGEGFSAADAAATEMVYNGHLTHTDVLADETKLVNPSTIQDITPYVLSNFDGGMTATYTAIVVPTRQIAVNELLATITIANNVYTVKSKETRTLESGKNYIYNVSVRKTGVSISSTIVDWEEVEGDAEAEIHFSAEAGTGQNGEGSNALNNSTTSFDIFSSNDGTNFDSDGDPSNGTQSDSGVHWVPETGNPGEDDYVPGHWETDVPLYWDNDKDDTFFTGFAPMGDTPSDGEGNLDLTAGPNDYLWGTSGPEAVQPNSGDVQLTFQHIMSKVVINVVTTDGDDAVDLSTFSTQLISSIAVKAKFNVGTGEYAPFQSSDYADYDLDLQEVAGSNQKKYTCEFFVFPQVLFDNSLVRLSVGVAPLVNNFTQQLNTIKADGVAVNEWKAGKRYIYTIILKKSAKTFTAKITDWEDVIAEDTEAEL